MKSKFIFAIIVALATIVTPLITQANAQIKIKGSDTLIKVAQTWIDTYQKLNPNVIISVAGGGSGTGISALANGTIDIANSSRKMTRKEKKSIKRARVKMPVEHIVGYDAIVILLHQDNPASSLSINQLKEIFAEYGTINKWSDIGINVPGCEEQKIVPVGRDSDSGTASYFRKRVMNNYKYKLGITNLHTSKEVVNLVESTPCAIGYSGMTSVKPQVKVACVSQVEGSDCINPSIQTTIKGDYPIARPLFMYTNGVPSGEIKQYIDWILSDEGLCILLENGNAPVRNVSCN